jgi:hypothetical protein
LHLACGNNHDGVVSILCMMLNLFLYFFFSFIDLQLYQFVWFFTIVQILCVNYMHKGQEETNVKTHYDSFGIDPMKMCLKHKTKMKVIIKFKILEMCFYQIIVICTHFRCYTTIDAHFIICALWRKKQNERIHVPKEKNIYYSLQCSFFIYIHI